MATDMPITDARDQLAEIVSLAAYRGQVTYLTRHGKRVAAIVPADDAEEIERIEDTWLAKQAETAQANIRAGHPTVALADVLSRLGVTEEDLKAAVTEAEQERADLETDLGRAA